MESFKHLMDALSLSVVFATLVNILPPLAALFSIMWICFQFYHSEPMKEYRRLKKEKKDGQG